MGQDSVQFNMLPSRRCKDLAKNAFYGKNPDIFRVYP